MGKSEVSQRYIMASRQFCHGLLIYIIHNTDTYHVYLILRYVSFQPFRHAVNVVLWARRIAVGYQYNPWAVIALSRVAVKTLPLINNVQRHFYALDCFSGRTSFR